MFRSPAVRICSAIIAIFLVVVLVSAGQAAFKNNGQGVAANLAEWARDHHLGPVVTFGEWLSYNPPPKGGKPSFSLTVPSGAAVSSGTAAKSKSKSAFVPDIPATLKSLAGSSIAGEGQWRVVSASANSDVMANWGATLDGGYYVWRSGIGITKDGRVVYVYGSALNAQDLGLLLQRAGAVEGMQLDINPAWMKFDYYQAKGKPGDPVPVPLLPTQPVVTAAAVPAFSPARRARAVIRTTRPRQWPKNLLVFAAPLAGGLARP